MGDDMLRDSAIIKEKWLRYAKEKYWGDDLDVRYYVSHLLRQIEGKKILDVGCGPGILLSTIPSSNSATGIDVSEESVAIAKKVAPNAELARGTMLSLPFDNSSFDMVVAAHVLPGYDFEAPRTKDYLNKFISEIHRVLKPGGRLIFTTPNGEHPCYRGKNKITYSKLIRLFEGKFDCMVHGYNPFPMPSRVLAHLPFIEQTLWRLADFEFLKKRGRSFYVEARKL